MARKRYRKTTPEERAAQQARHEHFMQLLQKRLEKDGITKEQAIRLIQPSE